MITLLKIQNYNFGSVLSSVKNFVHFNCVHSLNIMWNNCAKIFVSYTKLLNNFYARRSSACLMQKVDLYKFDFNPPPPII